MWNQGQRCGVKSQDVIAVDEFIDHPGTPPQRRGDSGTIVERRRVPRPLAERACAARWVARLIEYGVIAGVGAVAAVVVGAMLLDLFGRPIGAAGAVLSGEQVIAAR